MTPERKKQVLEAVYQYTVSNIDDLNTACEYLENDKWVNPKFTQVEILEAMNQEDLLDSFIP